LGGRRWFLLALAGLLMLSMIVGGALSLAILRSTYQAHNVALHPRSMSATAPSPGAGSLSYSLNNATASLNLDPNRLQDPATYDTRACVRNPSTATCNGLYPVTPQHVSPALGVKLGAGSCIDKTSKIVENQQIMDGTGTAVGTFQLWWLPTCRSAFGYVSFDFPASQLTSIQVWAQTETYGWWEQISQLPPWANDIEQTGPVPGSAIEQGHNDLYSPLIYAPADNVSAHIAIDRADGASFGNFTGTYKAGVFQYTGTA
jgi:hypothetical protein